MTECMSSARVQKLDRQPASTAQAQARPPHYRVVRLVGCVCDVCRHIGVMCVYVVTGHSRCNSSIILACEGGSLPSSSYIRCLSVSRMATLDRTAVYMHPCGMYVYGVGCGPLCRVSRVTENTPIMCTLLLLPLLQLLTIPAAIAVILIVDTPAL